MTCRRLNEKSYYIWLNLLSDISMEFPCQQFGLN